MKALLAASHRVYWADHADRDFPAQQIHSLADAAGDPFLTTGLATVWESLKSRDLRVPASIGLPSR
jgi:hypothetical protein